MNISIIGVGYVGLVTGACFAKLGHKVICMDEDLRKIKILKKGDVPFYEPGLKELISEVKNKGFISFTTNIKEAINNSDVIFICVGTPATDDGSADLSAVEKVAAQIGINLNKYRLIVEKSTVPVQTGAKIKRTIELMIKKNVDFDVASNPEFLRGGTAIKDFLYPDRIIIGVENERSEKILRDIYKGIDAPILVTSVQSAEIIKHASNSFLATKISFINAVSVICERTGADVKEVAYGMGLDKRIGPDFLNAGIGFGGSCFPKDLKAFIKIAESLGYNFGLLKEVLKINEEAREDFVKKIEDILWNLKDKKIVVMGLSFKPDTDDIRDAPSITIVGKLIEKGAKIFAYDPQGMRKFKELFPNINYIKDFYKDIVDADAIVFLTEWEEFKEIDLKRIKNLMKTPVIIDGRNIFEPDKLKEMGFIYKCVGRG